MHRTAYYVVNAITLYRLAAAFVLFALILGDRVDIFKWLLAVSFFTDMIDGYLARKYHVDSVWGARIDSLADDFTMLVGIIATCVLKPDFIRSEFVMVAVLLGLYVVQTVLAIIRYHRISSFHTYLAKGAALLQGSFLILLFFLPTPPTVLFYIASTVTILDISEEIILVLLLREWQTDVKGLYWVLRKQRQRQGR